jgi:hypothetical protein
VTRARGLALGVCVGAEAACGSVSSPRPVEPIVAVASPAPRPGAATARRVLTEAELTCRVDEDCGFDPATGACGNDARFNAQPPIVDQGVLCSCEAARCGTLRVWPTPCESDASCAVALAPRPHPVAASVAEPHARRCVAGVGYAATCERTNICTMHRGACTGPLPRGAGEHER